MTEHGAVVAPPDVDIRDTGTPRGRGVFAARVFRKGELVEASPVVIVGPPHDRLPPALECMVFSWPLSDGRPAAQALALGYGSLYNGANPANMRYERDLDGRLIRFFAARHIVQGEEMTVNYSAPDGAATSPDDAWFVEHEIRQIRDASC